MKNSNNQTKFDKIYKFNTYATLGFIGLIFIIKLKILNNF